MPLIHTQRQPDDWHYHLREGKVLEVLVRHTWPYNRLRVMPNLKPPITSLADIQRYLGEIKAAALAAGVNNEFLPSLYLTMDMTPADIIAAHEVYTGDLSVKSYPKGKTTNSDDGPISLRGVNPDIFRLMSQRRIVFNIHGEVPGVADLDSEEAFLADLEWLAGTYSDLPIILEHVSTARAVELVESLSFNVAATITGHHMRLTYQDVYGSDGSFHPHHKCMPVAKTPRDMIRIIEAATSGNPKFFNGNDPAAHLKLLKEAPLPPEKIPSGIYYSGDVAICLQAEVFEDADALDKLEGFTAVFGAQFHYLPVNRQILTLINEPWVVPQTVGNEDDGTLIVPFMAGQTLRWRVQSLAA